MPAIHVHLLPSQLENHSLSGATAVVIDVLRASTTIIHALAHGALAVIPCLTVEEANEKAKALPASARLLGGERHGALIPGFDLDNSPFNYGPETVQGKVVIFTTTNGTRALNESLGAKRICIGAFVNRQALGNAATQWGDDLHLVCAGTDDQLTAEDILFAGAVTSDLINTAPATWSIGNVAAQMAQDYFECRNKTPEHFQSAFIGSLGAQNLIELGMDRDIDRARQNDLFSGVPLRDTATGELHWMQI